MELRLVLFLAFFVGVGVAIFFSRNVLFELFFGRGLVLLVLTVGVLGLTVWPFFGWALYGNSLGTERTWHDLRVAGEDDSVIQYDQRAVEPAIATPIDRKADFLVTDASPDERRELGCYLLTQAIEYQDQVRNPKPKDLFYFPRHQYGIRWTPEDMQELGEVRSLVVTRVTIEFSESGTSVVSKSEQRVLEIDYRECS